MFEVDSALADYMLGQTKAVLAIDSPPATRKTRPPMCWAATAPWATTPA